MNLQDIATEQTPSNWVKPSLTVISVNNDTLGGGGTTGDGLGGSKVAS